MKKLSGFGFFLAVLALVCGATAAFAGRVVLVPRVTIYPGDTVTNGMLIEKEYRSDRGWRLPVYDARERVVGKVARRTLIAGQPIAENAVGDPDVVKQGSSYVLVFEDDGLSITGYGLALQSGSTGDVVSIRNVDSGTIVRGVVQADATVRVGGQ